MYEGAPHALAVDHYRAIAAVFYHHCHGPLVLERRRLGDPSIQDWSHRSGRSAEYAGVLLDLIDLQHGRHQLEQALATAAGAYQYAIGTVGQILAKRHL